MIRKYELDSKKIGAMLESCNLMEGAKVEDDTLYFDGVHYNNYILEFVIAKMLKSGEIELVVTNKAVKNNIDYIKKILGEKR